jgi:hypothetical protein
MDSCSATAGSSNAGRSGSTATPGSSAPGGFAPTRSTDTQDYSLFHMLREPLPGEVERWWRERGQMTLVRDGDGWRIQGVGKERARIAYAELARGSLVYSLNRPNLEPTPEL